MKQGIWFFNYAVESQMKNLKYNKGKTKYENQQNVWILKINLN